MKGFSGIKAAVLAASLWVSYIGGDQAVRADQIVPAQTLVQAAVTAPTSNDSKLLVDPDTGAAVPGEQRPTPPATTPAKEPAAGSVEDRLEEQALRIDYLEQELAGIHAELKSVRALMEEMAARQKVSVPVPLKPAGGTTSVRKQPAVRIRLQPAAKPTVNAIGPSKPSAGLRLSPRKRYDGTPISVPSKPKPAPVYDFSALGEVKEGSRPAEQKLPPPVGVTESYSGSTMEVPVERSRKAVKRNGPEHQPAKKPAMSGSSRLPIFPEGVKLPDGGEVVRTILQRLTDVEQIALEVRRDNERRKTQAFAGYPAAQISCLKFLQKASDKWGFHPSYLTQTQVHKMMKKEVNEATLSLVSRKHDPPSVAASLGIGFLRIALLACLYLPVFIWYGTHPERMEKLKEHIPTFATWSADSRIRIGLTVATAVFIATAFLPLLAKASGG